MIEISKEKGIHGKIGCLTMDNWSNVVKALKYLNHEVVGDTCEEQEEANEESIYEMETRDNSDDAETGD